jgi:putative intracellular protease/amidase
MKKILIPLPDHDFDVTEVSVPWKLFKNKQYKIVFATEAGNKAKCDPKLITGVLFGQLGANKEAIAFYREMENSSEFIHPIKYSDIDPNEFDILHLPGGHAPGMRQYLESKLLQDKVLTFFKLKKLVGSICHGSIVLARTIDPATQKSIVHDYQLTGLTKLLERTAYYLTFWKLGKYYRTYPEYVEDEIKNVLKDKNNFRHGSSPSTPFVCSDRNLVSSRWPKDAYVYAEKLIELADRGS